MDKNLNFGEKLKKIRKEKGWSLDKLGEKAGLQGRLIGKYESGKVAPTANSIIKIAKTLNITTDYLLLDENNDSKPYQNLKDRKLLELFEELEKMDEKEKETVISLIDAFIAKNKIKKIIK